MSYFKSLQRKKENQTQKQNWGCGSSGTALA
jgi:hypothetical protein